MNLSVNIDLSLSNVSREIWNGMGDVVVGHGQDGDLSDGSAPPLHTSGPLVNGGQIGVHVAGETTTARNLLSSSRHLGTRHTLYYSYDGFGQW